MTTLRLFLILAVLLVLITANEAKSKRKKMVKSMVLRKKETNAVEFIRLTVMRLIYGVATRLGLGEQISEALNGVFIPPGVDDDDDYGGGFGFFDREDDYDY